MKVCGQSLVTNLSLGMLIEQERHFCRSPSLSTMGDQFYCRYYVGHKGKFGHEFMEFEITSDGKLRYANNSNYKNDFMIRKEGTQAEIFIILAFFGIYIAWFCIVTLSTTVIEEIKRIIRESEITREDDRNWPPPDRVGRQELEIKMDKEHISFTVSSWV